MDDRVFDTFTRRLASLHTRRSALGKLAALALTGSLAAARRQAALAKPEDKVTICALDQGSFTYSPKQLPSPAAQAQVNGGKAVYPLETSDSFCPEACGEQCLSCEKLPSGTACNKCVNGQCTCPPSTAGTFSYQGGLEGTVPLPGSSYQIFNYDETTQTIGGTALSGVQTVTDPAGLVTFGGFSGDTNVCIKEVGTPAGYTLIGHDFACLHLDCGHEFLWSFPHTP